MQSQDLTREELYQLDEENRKQRYEEKYGKKNNKNVPYNLAREINEFDENPHEQQGPQEIRPFPGAQPMQFHQQENQDFLG